MMAMNTAPGSVIRLTALARYDSVCGPGRTPGMKPPWRRIWSAWRTGSKAIEL